MLTETKVKLSKEINDRIRKESVIYLTNSDTLIDALAAVVLVLSNLQRTNEITDGEILSCKQSSIKEVAEQFNGEKSYVATLKDIWVDEISGEEKSLRYKVFLCADDLAQCNTFAQQLQREGYDMQVESLTEINMKYINSSVTVEQQ